jgi:hypothetical protein
MSNTKEILTGTITKLLELTSYKSILVDILQAHRPVISADSADW